MQRTRRRSRPDSPAERKRLLRSLPALSRLLEARPVAGVTRRFGPDLTRDLLREVLGGLREEILSGKVEGSDLKRRLTPAAIARAATEAGDALLAPRPRRVINATGVVVHTNLGRSLLSADAAEHLAETVQGYVDLEYDLGHGERGSRLAHLEPLLTRLFPGQGFTVVNNNAAAIMLCLRALCRGKEVIVSRGELVEIGGSFRVPDILAASGARLREIGTTNRTRLADYRKAITTKTGMILKVHTSNFKIVGFAEETSVSALADLAADATLPLVVDWGSGDLVDLGPLGIHDEMPVREVLDAGADLVTFSGDKLLGGPQAGFVVGQSDLVEKLRRDPLSRVCRLDRMLITALHRTLAAYVRGTAFDEVPTLRMLSLEPAEIGRRAMRVKREVGKRVGRRVGMEVIDGVSRPGGGSSPAGERPTRLLAVRRPEGDAGVIEQRLREGDPPVVGRVQDGRLLLDLRTVPQEMDGLLVERLAAAIEDALPR